MFFDSLLVFHMVWKNQESCESWLVEFGVSRRSKVQKVSASAFFVYFWATIMDLLITLRY